MAPISFWNRLLTFYSKPSNDPPVLSPTSTVLLSLFITLAYVVPLYFSSLQLSPTLSRDAPAVIRSRIRAATISCIVSTLIALTIIIRKGHATPAEAVALLGWWPINVGVVFRSVALTVIFFSGPLFERGIAQGEWRTWIQPQQTVKALRGWIAWRNYVAGPVSEEIIFRSIIVSLHLLSRTSPTRIVFIAPLYFGVAHVHHFYEFRLTHPDTPVHTLLLRSLFQFTYTTVFGWFATFLYLRTGSLLAVILVHSFCNWCGLPRLWGRVETAHPTIASANLQWKEDTETSKSRAPDGRLGIAWTIAYYLLLAAGTAEFYLLLWPLSRSSHALASFGEAK